MDDKVERALSVLAEDLIDDVVEFACKLAKHRGSNILQRNDIKLSFEKRLKVKVPLKTNNQNAAGANGSLQSSSYGAGGYV